MNDNTVPETHVKTHWSLWVVGVLSLIWNLMGCANFIWQMNISPGDLTSLSEAQRAVIENRPVWATAGFALAVFAGAIGSILLLLRKRAALVFFLLSVVGVIITMLPLFGIVSSGVVFSGFERVMYLLLTPVVAAFLVVFTRVALRRKWAG